MPAAPRVTDWRSREWRHAAGRPPGGFEGRAGRRFQDLRRCAPGLRSGHVREVQPPRRRDQPLSAAARPQPGRLVPVGARGARRGRPLTDRPIFLSIGYAACHWCHVMERESFEDEETAAAPERELRLDQGGPRGAARPGRGLHGGPPVDDRRRRLADEPLPDARRSTLLRRHVLPARAEVRHAIVPADPGGGGEVLERASCRARGRSGSARR